MRNLGAENVIALGNGNNDRKMLKAATIGIAVCLNEGCALEAALSANILLLLQANRLKATLRF